MARPTLLSASTALGLVCLTTLLEPAPEPQNPTPARPVAIPGAPQDQDPTKDRPFKHSDHVPGAWAQRLGEKWQFDETARDCRGCHVYAAGQPPRDPQAVCYHCHVRDEKTNKSNFEVSFEPGWDTLEKRRDPHRSFRHHQHAILACRECHAPTGHGVAPETMPITTGFGQCSRCHAPDREGAVKRSYDLLYVPEDERGADPKKVDQKRATEGLLRTLNKDPAMLPANLGPFRHSDHLRDPLGKRSLEDLLTKKAEIDDPSCTTCHDPGADITGLHAKRFKTTSCGECHVGQVGGKKEPLVFEDRLEPASSHSALTFSHQQHLGYDRAQRKLDVSSAAGYDLIEGGGCNACHEYSATENTFVFKDVIEHKANTHEGCRECHDHNAWSPGHHGDWNKHGCKDCHAFDRDSLKSDRPEIAVRRHRASAFFLGSHSHPHIGGDGKPTDAYDKTCKACHKVKFAELPSRLQKREFSHSTHLSETATAEDCKLCHSIRVAKADSPAEIGNYFDGKALDPNNPHDAARLGLSYDPQACGTCHHGKQPPRPLDMKQPESRVPLFAHTDHVGKKVPAGAGLAGDSMDCLTCHLPGPAGGVDADRIGWQPGVRDCSKCHDHAGWKESISGDINSSQAASCAKCHKQRFPAADGMLAVQRARATALKPGVGQHHAENSDCTDCHVAAKPLEAPQEDHVRVNGGLPDGKLGKPDMHRGDYIRDMQDVLCLWCHWTRKAGFAFESKDNRDRLGAKLQAKGLGGKIWPYPGGPYAPNDKAWPKK